MGGWVGTQRSLKSKDELSDEKIALLDELDLVWNAHEANWLEIMTSSNHTNSQKVK